MCGPYTLSKFQNIQVFIIFLYPIYTEFCNVILHTCRMHHGQHPDFFLDFSYTFKYSFWIFVNKGITGLQKPTWLFVQRTSNKKITRSLERSSPFFPQHKSMVHHSRHSAVGDSLTSMHVDVKYVSLQNYYFLHGLLDLQNCISQYFLHRIT